MTREQLIAAGFSRVERDDRLLDVFPKETSEKGVELWERWTEKTVEIVRFHNNKLQCFSHSSADVKQALLEYKSLLLTN